MKTILILVFLEAAALSCKSVEYLDLETNATFCNGARNLVQHVNSNNNLPQTILPEYSLKASPDKLIHADVPPQFKEKILTEQGLPKKWKRTKFYHSGCLDSLGQLHKPVVDYFFYYQKQDNIIVLSLGTINEQTLKQEYYYYIALVDAQGTIQKIEESRWVEK